MSVPPTDETDPPARPRLPGLPRLLLRSLATLGRGRRARALAAASGDGIGSASMRFVARLDPVHVARYAEHFGGFVSDVPPTYPYLLAHRAQLALMLQPEFPLPVPGLVHVANRITCARALAPGDPIVLDAHARQEPVAARRTRIVFQVDIGQSGHVRWRCLSTYLHRPRAARRRPRDAAAGTPDRHDPDHAAALHQACRWPAVADWSLPADTGRRYARLAGDFNPIHLHPALSRWFGYRAPIAHGMDLIARVAAAIEANRRRPVATLDAQFVRPVVLPAQVRCRIGLDDSASGAFALTADQDTLLHVHGTFGFDACD